MPSVSIGESRLRNVLKNRHAGRADTSRSMTALRVVVLLAALVAIVVLVAFLVRGIAASRTVPDGGPTITACARTSNPWSEDT